MNALSTALVGIREMSREQLEVALHAAAFATVAGFLKQHPMPDSIAADQRAVIVNELVGLAIIEAIDTAGRTILDEVNKGAQEENAKDIAAAAIAKAAGKLQ